MKTDAEQFPMTECRAIKPEPFRPGHRVSNLSSPSPTDRDRGAPPPRSPARPQRPRPPRNARAHDGAREYRWHRPDTSGAETPSELADHLSIGDRAKPLIDVEIDAVGDKPNMPVGQHEVHSTSVMTAKII